MNLHHELPENAWQTPTAPPRLPSGAVHVWRVPLRQNQDEISRLNLLLSPDERERFSRFRFAPDRAAHTVARGRLREILAGYSGVAPGALRFGYTENGKPYLAEHPDLQFNLSHAGDWALVACTYDVEIGVDVEVIDRSFQVEDIVERYFSRREVPVILGLPEAERHAAFYRAWTRKEAIIKARGDGLSLPLDQFGVSILPDDPVRVLHTDWAQGEEKKWQLRSFTVGEALGAVAWLGAGRDVLFYR